MARVRPVILVRDYRQPFPIFRAYIECEKRPITNTLEPLGDDHDGTRAVPSPIAADAQRWPEAEVEVRHAIVDYTEGDTRPFLVCAHGALFRDSLLESDQRAKAYIAVYDANGARLGVDAHYADRNFIRRCDPEPDSNVFQQHIHGHGGYFSPNTAIADMKREAGLVCWTLVKRIPCRPEQRPGPVFLTRHTFRHGPAADA